MPLTPTPWDRWPLELCEEKVHVKNRKNPSPRALSLTEKSLSNLLDGVMMNKVGCLVMVLEGGHSGLNLLQLLSHQLLRLQRGAG